MTHVVQNPTEPVSTSDGALEIVQLPAAKDNLIWLIVAADGSEVAAVDGPDAGPVLAYCDRRGLTLTTVINTHTHHDHIGINLDLERRGLLGSLRVVGPAKVADGVPGITERVEDGSEVSVGGALGRVLLTEGHIDGHVSYVFDDVLFCGDTLFAAGCGYLFDGPPRKMFQSLKRLAALSAGTRVCCAHEYTEDNLRFAWSVEPENAALAERIRAVWELRREGRCTLPSRLADELETNPFLRAHSSDLRRHVAEALPERALDDDESVFAATRALKDRKDYRKRSDDALPLR
jgi:hydroxyacylglutathione hydrolase